MTNLGKKVAAEYRSRYGTEPSQAQRYVDGAVRPVKWYKHEETSWADVVIQCFFMGYDGIARDHSAIGA